MNRVANFVLRFAIRAAVHRRELNVLSCPCKRNWKRAGVAGKVPSDLRRMAVRNPERAGLSRSTVMMMVGHRSESVYRGIAITNKVMLKESAAKLSAPSQKGGAETELSECSKTRK
jgi:hypothetical protein